MLQGSRTRPYATGFSDRLLGGQSLRVRVAQGMDAKSREQ